jgi:signal transduction histidine kinase
MRPAAGNALVRPAPFSLRGYLGRALRSGLYGLVVGAVIAFLNSQSLWVTLVYSLCIALLCWFCLDLGRRMVAQWVPGARANGLSRGGDGWPGWPWMSVIILVGCTIAYSGGTALGDWITGLQSPNLFGTRSLRESIAALLFCVVPAVAITHFFYARGAIAQRDAAAESARQQADESRLKLLESQLEPHMLFNTLANLRVLIAADPPRAQAMLDQLIAFLRATLSGSRALEHPLASEFARLQDYLALMQVRMVDRLSSRFELPDSLAHVPVPPLLLQPLVENCIKHGLEPAIAGGQVEVCAAREGDVLVLSVRDTGVGLPAGIGTDGGFGLRQVRERLATLYGSGASLTLEVAQDTAGGTLATIRLPLAPAPRVATVTR